MAYESNGSLTTDKRVVDDTTTWDTQSDWEAYQSITNLSVVNGAVELAEVSLANADYRWPATNGDGSTVLNPSIGDVDISLNFSTWMAAPQYNGGTAPEFDGADDIATSASAVGINGTQGTVCFWLESGDDGGAVSGIWDGSGDVGNPTDGPQAFTEGNNSEIGYRFFSNGSPTNIVRNLSVPDLTTNHLFFAFTFNGDDGEVFVYDTSAQQANATGTGTRRSTSGETLTLMAGLDDYTAGIVDDIVVNTSTALSQTQIEEIWNNTGPNV